MPTRWLHAGMRHRVTTSREGLWSGKPFKALTQGTAKTGGRNNHGHICTWHRGGGHRSGLCSQHADSHPAWHVR